MQHDLARCRATDETADAFVRGRSQTPRLVPQTAYRPPVEAQGISCSGLQLQFLLAVKLNDVRQLSSANAAALLLGSNDE
jgi:hypothetical protein